MVEFKRGIGRVMQEEFGKHHLKTAADVLEFLQTCKGIDSAAHDGTGTRHL